MADSAGDAPQAVGAFSDRRQRLAERAQRKNLDGWILVPGPNLRYCTGLEIEASERVFLLGLGLGGQDVAVVPYFEAERVRQHLPGVRLITYRDESGPEAAIARAFGPVGLRPAHLGAEFQVMRLFERVAVEGSVPRARWHAIDHDLAVLRQVKDDREVGAVRRAAAIAVAAVRSGCAAVAPGVSEADVAARCQEVLLRAHTTSPFGVQVASGPRSADPHAQTSDRRMEPGDLVWIDLGAVVEGYCADITRTIGVGEPPEALRRALAVVTDAQARAIGAVAPGVSAEAIDAAARTQIAAAGLGAAFTHRTGHGIGLAVHEAPFIVDGNAEPLQSGMVFTVEPGVYLAGRGGVRMEDDVLVTAAGAEVLTRAGGEEPR